MCTLIAGRDVLGPGTMLLGANRDENAGRPSDPPRLLSHAPLVVGGRDRLAGGTWLAVREGPAAVALLNRRDPVFERGTPPPPRRSRGLLALDVARLGGERALEQSLALVRASSYGPFTLFFASPMDCWAIAHEPDREPRVIPVTPGWHVLTHQELDDRSEPRAAWLVEHLRGYVPGSPAEAEDHMATLLRRHGDDGAPAVCLHDGRMVTVSSSIVYLDEHGVRYRHAEGRPCERAFEDQSDLLERDQPGESE